MSDVGWDHQCEVAQRILVREAQKRHMRVDRLIMQLLDNLDADARRYERAVRAARPLGPSCLE